MGISVPKPMHGWRAFWGEVGIIVLGVLIALAAQQVVETIQWRKEVAGFRDSVREEISRTLGTYPYRAKQKSCINSRLDELQRWLDGWRAGRPMKLAGPIGMPNSHVIRTSVWASRDPETFAHMPREEKQEYAFLYDESRTTKCIVWMNAPRGLSFPASTARRCSITRTRCACRN